MHKNTLDGYPSSVFRLFMRPAGLEPAQVYTTAPQDSASAIPPRPQNSLVYQMFAGISI